MRFIDAHVHCILPAVPEGYLPSALAALRAAGLEKMVVLGAPAVEMPRDLALRLVPKWVRPHFMRANLQRPESEMLREMVGADVYDEVLVSFLDTRFYVQRSYEAIKAAAPLGFRGLKVMHVVDDDPVGIDRMHDALGLTVDEFHDTHRQVFDAARELKVPVLYHLKVASQVEWVRHLLTAYPEVRVDIPHFGYSRRVMEELLAEFANLYSDTSSLLPYMQQEPERYRDFIARHPNQILLGSDCSLFDLSGVTAYVQFIADLGLSPSVRDAVLHDNAGRFLG